MQRNNNLRKNDRRVAANRRTKIQKYSVLACTYPNNNPKLMYCMEAHPWPKRRKESESGACFDDDEKDVSTCSWEAPDPAEKNIVHLIGGRPGWVRPPRLGS